MNTNKKTATTVAVSSVAVILGYLWHKLPPKPRRLTLQAQCNCGKVSLLVDEKAPVHLVCYCDDCQGYAKWVKIQAATTSTSPSHAVSDVQGGSRTCQVFRRNVKILQGSELLEFTYLDPTKVPSRPQRMYRGHATCCNTPMCSAFWGELPVMGLYAANFVLGPKSFLAPDPVTKVWERRAETVSGCADTIPPPEYRINCRYALVDDKDNDKPKGHPDFPVLFLLRFLWRNFVVGPKVLPGDFSVPSPSNIGMRPA